MAALDSDRETLDPHQATGTIDYMVLMHVFDHLIARNPESMKLVGGLAESWRTVDDLTWEFKIRKGVKFQNGEPVNAQAVKLSIDRVLDPAQKYIPPGPLQGDHVGSGRRRPDRPPQDREAQSGAP